MVGDTNISIASIKFIHLISNRAGHTQSGMQLSNVLGGQVCALYSHYSDSSSIKVDAQKACKLRFLNAHPVLIRKY